jgi:putative tricarboxylic transport membrane protein
MVKSDGWKKILTDKNWLDLYLAGDDFAKFLTAENARITDTLKQIGLVQ